MPALQPRQTARLTPRQKHRSDRRPRARLAWLLLFVAAWGLGQALALAHRAGHADGMAAPPALHVVGGEHHDGDAQCRLVDQVAAGDTLCGASPVLAVAPLVADAAGVPATPPLPGAAPAAYQARGPPGG